MTSPPERSSGATWAAGSRSALRDVRWPTVLAGRPAVLASVLGQMDRAQWLPPAEIEALQFVQLDALVAHAFERIPWYGERLRGAGVTPGEPVDAATWARIPVLERAEIQEHDAALRVEGAFAQHGALKEIATSGSTGRPIRVLKTELTGLFWDAATLRAHDWAAWDAAGILAAIKWFPDGVAAWPGGSRGRDWGEPYSSLCESGPSFALAITATVAQQAEWLSRVQPDYLTVFPSILPDLVQECAARAIRLERLKQVRAIGECVDPAVRVLCRERWGVPLQDAYSAQEVGYMAIQCPTGEHYHVQSECVRLEVLDARGQGCAPGETGRIVVTPLHNFAMPLLRYAIGDYAEVGPPCACGRGLPVLNRILGRTRNMLVLPDGSRLWPRLSELRYSEVLPVTQFQVVQTAPTRLEVRLVAGRKGTPDEEARLRAIVVERIGYPFEVGFAYLDEIPRSAGGKFEDFRSEL